jgi:hypothetical protein
VLVTLLRRCLLEQQQVRRSGQSRQRKATSSYLASTKFLAQPTEFEESVFCNSL